MPDLREQLREILQDRVCLVGVGNVDRGDDGFGVRLLERLRKRGTRNAERGMPETESRNAKAAGNSNPEVRTGAPQIRDSGCGPRTFLGPRRSDLELEILTAGTSPDRWVAQLTAGSYDAVLFLDAVEFGAAPGSVALFNSGEMLTKFPQISTHRLSLGLLARLLEGNGRTRVWLLGVQPASLRSGAELSTPVRTSLALLVQIITQLADAHQGAEKKGSPLACFACFAGIPGCSAFRVPRSALPC